MCVSLQKAHHSVKRRDNHGVNDSIETITRTLKNGALRAFESIDNGKINEGLEVLRSQESAVLILFENVIDPSDSVAKHLIFWLQSSRGTVLHNVGRFSEAALLFESVACAAEELEVTCLGAGIDCFDHELFAAKCYQARALEAQGRFRQALEILFNVHKQIPPIDHATISKHNELLRQVIDRYGSSLGYSKLSARTEYEIQADQPSSIRFTSYQEWSAPLPLDGPTFSHFLSREASIVHKASSVKELQPTQKLTTEIERLDVLTEWHDSAPFLADVGFARVNSLFRKATLEVELNLVAQFFDTWSALYEEILKFKLQFPEFIDFSRGVGSGFYHLGAAIVNHKFDDVDTFQRMCKVCTVCVAEGIDFFLKTQKHAPTTQASALIACELLNLQAINCDLFGDKKLANHSRNQRNAVLGEILARDPNNDRAKKLQARYGHRKRWANPMIAQEIRGWNWSIVPTV